MYPGLSDLINDFFGTHFSVSFPPTFGTLVAISFLLAAWTLKIELKRKEKLGLIFPEKQTMLIGQPASAMDLISNGIFGFILGFKLVYIFAESNQFFSDPPGILLSTKGNFPGAIAGAALFVYLKYREKNKEKLPEPKIQEITVSPFQRVPEFTMAAAFGGLLGAKIFHIFEYWSDFMADPVGMFFSGSGLTMYGGLIVGAIATIWYGKKHGVPMLQLSDAAAPGLMLAYGTGRIGCQLAGDGDWGIINMAPKPGWMSFLPDWFWSFKYPHNVISEGVQIPGCEGRHCFELMHGVYPTPLYESIACILLFFLLWWMRKKTSIPGMIFSFYLLFNGIERFLIESIRVNSKYHVAGIEFTQAQLISLLLIVTGLAGIFILRSRRKLKSDF
ncbi:MAG TPA: prolipoprotein diacylglyceryl transferase [Bacteroidia bacterium]|nr:prolipoprotein diacylglyceryl transferase [Bacteroidia bacterium]